MTCVNKLNWTRQFCLPDHSHPAVVILRPDGLLVLINWFADFIQCTFTLKDVSVPTLGLFFGYFFFYKFNLSSCKYEGAL